MKTIIRLLVILLAVATVIGVTWAVGQYSGSDTQTAFVQGEQTSVSSSEERPAPPEGFEEREGGDSRTAQWTSLSGWMGLGETVVPITIIIAAVTLPVSLWNRYQRVRQHTAASAT